MICFCQGVSDDADPIRTSSPRTTSDYRMPLTIKHGPARLLAHFVLEGDKAARRKGSACAFDMISRNSYTSISNKLPHGNLVSPARQL